MPNVQITQLPAALPLDGTEQVPVVQQGITVRTTTAAIAASPSQQQTFLTVNQEPTLPNSRYLTADPGISVTDGGAQSTLNLALTGAAASLNAASTGFVVKDSGSTVVNRSIASSGVGLSVANGSGVGGNPTISLSGQIANFASASATGLLTLTSGGAVSATYIQGISGQTSVTNGNGISGPPTVGLTLTGVIPGSYGSSNTVPVVTVDSYGRISSITLNSITSSGTVTQINTGFGLLGGPITTAGTISVDTSLIVTLTGSQTISDKIISGSTNTLSNIGNSSLIYSAITINGSSVSLGGSITVTAINPEALTIGTGLLGGSYDGSTPVTIEIDSTVVTLDGVQTLTNKSMSGSSNTFTNIPNSALTNDSVTFNGVSVALGGSGSITAVAPNALTIGTGLSGTSYNGSSAVTIAIDSTVATLTGTQTLENKTISGLNNTLTNIANTSLVNSSVTINGSSVSLGGAITVTATATNPLTIGTGLTGTSYDGSSPVTIAIDSTVATLSGSQTLTNKTISGATNTLTSIGNSSLTNSSVTINGSSVSLGGSTTVTAVNPNALTIGAGLTGTSYDGSSAVTIAIDSTVATLTGAQTLTNKSINGNDNTLTNIGNSSLVNSSVTFNGVAVSLGASGTITANTTNSLTFDNSGTGAASGTAFNGSTAYTVSYNTVGASPLAGSTSITTVGTITTGTWHGSSIDNSYLTNSSMTLGTTNVALGGTTLTLAGLTSITLTQDPTSDLQVATKQYVDSIASGLNYHQPVNYASTAALPAYTYNNGIGGVGATITANANGVLSFGGGSPTAGQRLLVKDEAGANQPYNGVYTVTSAGSAGSPFQLTRATDYDTSGSGTNEIDAGDYVLVISGTNASTAWVQQTPLPIIVGTTALVFLQFNAPITYTAGTGLNLSPATTFNISNTGVSAASYGTASSVPTIAVNAQGQITSASDTSIAINGNQITSGTVGSSYISGSYTGITGVGTLTAGTWNATPISNSYLANSSITINGSSVSLGGSTTVTSNTANSVTFDNSGTGAASGTAFNGGTAYTISYNTIGASPLIGSTSLTTLGTVTTGVWHGSSIDNSYLTNSSITINGSSVSLGGSVTVTATAANALTFGTHLTGTSYNGSSPVTIGTDATDVNTASTIVARDSSGNFSAGTISAALSGNATSATNIAGGSAGALPYNTGSGSTSFLSLGTTNYVLTAGAAAPQYVAQSTLSVGSATNATNSTNVATTVTTVNADYYIPFVAAASTSNQPLGIQSGLKYNPSTQAVTAGISGGTF